MKLLTVALVLPLLAACGGGDGSGGEEDATAAIRSAAQDYSDAYLTGDGDGAYALLSERCQQRMSAEEFGGLVDAAADQYGQAMPFKSFSAEVNKDQARVTYTFTDSNINQTDEPWVLENGDWREDDC